MFKIITGYHLWKIVFKCLLNPTLLEQKLGTTSSLVMTDHYFKHCHALSCIIAVLICETKSMFAN